MTIKLFEKTYDGESLIDYEQHLYDLLDSATIPKDKWGFYRGRFKIIVEWEDETPD